MIFFKYTIIRKCNSFIFNVVLAIFALCTYFVMSKFYVNITFLKKINKIMCYLLTNAYKLGARYNIFYVSNLI